MNRIDPAPVHLVDPVDARFLDRRLSCSSRIIETHQIRKKYVVDRSLPS